MKYWRYILTWPVFALGASRNESQDYTSIGGQAVIEGVMMRSPNTFVIALRLAGGKICLRKDQWFGLSKRFRFFKKPFLRGIIMVVEAMINGIVALNFSANKAMQEEIKEGASPDKKKWQSEQVNFATFFTMLVSFALGMGLFVFLPHWLTILLGNSNVETFSFHLVDGIIKAAIFILYIYLIALLPDIRRIFQYHGAEHKAIATFEAGHDLTVAFARSQPRLHPRCGTSFLFFLIFISIIIFSVVFVLLPVGQGYPFVLKHLAIILFKILLMFPVAGISYEIIRYAARTQNLFCSSISYPGILLQKITTQEPDDSQLEVALTSIKTVLHLEEHFKLTEIKKKVLSAEEIEIDSIDDIAVSNLKLKDFLE